MPDDSRDSDRRIIRLLIVVLVSSFLGKAILRLASDNGGPNDYWRSGYSFYHRMAANLLRTGSLFFGSDGPGEVRYDCFRPPMYPGLIAGVSWLTNDSSTAFIFVEAFISTLIAATVFWMTRALAGTRPAFWAATLSAFGPYAFYHDTQQQETVLYTFFSTLGFALVVNGRSGARWSLLWAGLATGFAVLTRTSHAATALLLMMAIAAMDCSHRWVAIRRSLVFAIGVAIAVTPWLIRNKVVKDHFTLTSETGFALTRAHNAETFRFFPWQSIDLSWKAYHRSMPDDQRQALQAVVHDEFACSDWYKAQAVEYVRAHPLQTIKEGFIKVGVNLAGVISPLGSPAKNWTYAFGYWVSVILACVGWRTLSGSRFPRLFLAMLIAQAAVAFVFWSHTSHRAYVDPLIAVPAGLGLSSLLERRFRPSNPPV